MSGRLGMRKIADAIADAKAAPDSKAAPKSGSFMVYVRHSASCADVRPTHRNRYPPTSQPCQALANFNGMYNCYSWRVGREGRGDRGVFGRGGGGWGGS